MWVNNEGFKRDTGMIFVSSTLRHLLGDYTKWEGQRIGINVAIVPPRARYAQTHQKVPICGTIVIPPTRLSRREFSSIFLSTHVPVGLDLVKSMSPASLLRMHNVVVVDYYV